MGFNYWAIGVLLVGVLTVAPISGQVANPVPASIVKSGLAVEIEDWVTVPQSSSSAPKARISHAKPMPGLAGRLMNNDMRGKLFVIDDGVISQFLDVANVVGSDFFDEEGLGTGLHSFAFHPRFATNGLFYTNHVEREGSGAADLAGPLTGNDVDQQAVLLEWDMVDPSATVYDGGSPREVIRLDVRSNSHGMQEIAFNPLAEPSDEDYGQLFVCIGDGGSVLRGVKDQPAGAEDDTGRIDSPLGSILRIAPILDNSHQSADFSVSANGMYWIPKSNPFINTMDLTPGDGADTVKEIYCYGFRNPHRISWDTGGTGKMLGVCIGQNNLEEVNLIQPGNNYGWPLREGTFLLDTNNASSPDDVAVVYPLPANDSGYTYPVAQYDHDEGFAITGGYVYRGTAVPDLAGKYLFGDIVNGRIFCVDESALALGSQAPISELTLLHDNVETTLKTLVDNNRADLRFGIDHDGEILIITKTDGKIRRLKPAGDDPIIPIRSAEDWALVANFETEDLSGITATNSSANDPSVSVVNDPYESSANKVLVIAPADASDAVNVSLPIPSIADGETGTVYLRFAIEDSATNDASWGISDVVTPTTWSDFEATLLSKDGDALQVRDGASYTDTGSSIRNATWYEMWLTLDNTADTYSLSMKGGDWTAQTEVAAGLAFRNGTSDALQTFFWRVRNLNGAAANARLYFDDLYVDVENVNLTDPKANDWRLLSDFEGTNPLSEWGYDSSKETVEIVQGAQSNHYMKRTLSTSGSSVTSTALWTPLPSPISVSSKTTFYWRFSVDDGDLTQSMGVSNINVSTTPTAADFEARMRLLDDDSGAYLAQVRDSEQFQPSTSPPTLTRGQWYECWMVVNNGAIPSGGQTYAVYLRGGPEFKSQTLLRANADFQNGLETSLTQFFFTASAPEDASAAPFCIDDLYQFTGVNLEGPVDAYTEPSHMLTGNNLAVHFTVDANKQYQIEGSDNLTDWFPISDAISSASSLPLIDNIALLQRRFYRVRELPPGN